jgi:hypothetical protein
VGVATVAPETALTTVTAAAVPAQTQLIPVQEEVTHAETPSQEDDVASNHWKGVLDQQNSDLNAIVRKIKDSAEQRRHAWKRCMVQVDSKLG